jgi:phosphoserine phosphatase RsbU/P
MHTSKSPVRLLHLEDNPRAAQLVQEQLRSDGLECHITHVEGQSQFEAAVLRNEFDLVLCDYNIPSYDGFSAISEAHRAQPDVPVIFISGAMGDEQALKTRSMGAAGYLLKYHLEELAPTVKRALRAAAEPQRRQAQETVARKQRLSPTHAPSAAAA